MAGILLEGDNVTDAERAAHARKISQKNRAESRKRLAELKSRVGNRKLDEASRVTGEVQATS